MKQGAGIRIVISGFNIEVIHDVVGIIIYYSL